MINLIMKLFAKYYFLICIIINQIHRSLNFHHIHLILLIHSIISFSIFILFIFTSLKISSFQLISPILSEFSTIFLSLFLFISSSLSSSNKILFIFLILLPISISIQIADSSLHLDQPYDQLM